MEVLIISNSFLIIRHLIESNQFEKVSILYFSNKKLVIQDSLLKKISSINVSSSKKEFSEILRSFKNDTRCISFGSSYIFNNFDINHFKFTILNFNTGKITDNRGRTPLFWDILNNEKYCYGTLHAIDEEIDMGVILDEVKASISNIDNPRTLAEKLVMEIINKKILLKWLGFTNFKILDHKKLLSKGFYKKAFYPEDCFNSSKYSKDELLRLWRCYSIWGKININGFFLKDISDILLNQNSIEINTLDNETIYGVKLN